MAASVNIVAAGRNSAAGDLATIVDIASTGTTTWVFSGKGGAPRHLRDNALSWSVSPDGSTIAFTTNTGTRGDRELWFMATNGSHARKLYEIGRDFTNWG